MEQAFVHGAAIAGGGLEQLAMAFDRLAQALAREHDLLIAGEPQVLADARPIRRFFEQEEPAFHLGAGRDGREAGAQRQVARPAVLGQAAELDPGVADAPLVAVHQQVPGHLLAAVAIGFDAGRAQLRVEQEGQGQRQHLGFSGAVVAAQQQVAVAEPEFLAVVVEQLDQPEPQRLPAAALRLGQRRVLMRGVECVEDVVAHEIRSPDAAQRNPGNAPRNSPDSAIAPSGLPVWFRLARLRSSLVMN